MTAVLVTGAAGTVGRRVVEALARSDDVERVVAVDRRSSGVEDDKVERVASDLARPDALGDVDRSDVIVHLAYDADIGTGGREVNTRTVRTVLAETDRLGADHVVLLSSATVYGAYPNNPVPITESAPLRPNSGFGYAIQKAELEQLVDEWRLTKPGRTVTVLRPCTALAEYGTSWIARALAAGAGVLAPREDPPAQFLHVDDLVNAVTHSVDHRLDGAFNVAPDGWIDGATVRALAGARARVRPPEWFRAWVLSLRWRFQH